MSDLKLAFIGLGNMGGPMARNLLAAGFDLTVADLDRNKVDALVEIGARSAADAVAAVAGADVVLTSLPGPTHVRAIGNQIVPAMRAGAVWVELSTNDLDCAHHLAQLADSHDIALLDAPVTGGAEGAEAGTLNLLVGGSAEVHERCVPVFTAIGDRYDLLGPAGAGYVAKISQVMLCYLNSVCLTEALLLGAKGGVDPAKMLDVIQNSTGRSYVADRYGPELLNGQYDTSFDLGLASKDLRLALQLAEQVGATLAFTADVGQLYERAEAEFGFDAPHLMAMQLIENENAPTLYQRTEPAHER